MTGNLNRGSPNGTVIGWRVEVVGSELRLSKWGHPDRVWTFPLDNYLDATTADLPRRLTFDEVPGS